MGVFYVTCEVVNFQQPSRSATAEEKKEEPLEAVKQGEMAPAV